MAKSAGKTQAGLFIASQDSTLQAVHFVNSCHLIESLCVFSWMTYNSNKQTKKKQKHQ